MMVSSAIQQQIWRLVTNTCLEIETFTMNPGTGKLTSCIQVKLHPYSAYVSIGGF